MLKKIKNINLSFQYLYSISWRNLAQSIEHSIRIDAYSHIQNLHIKWFEEQKAGNITSIINDDIYKPCLNVYLNNPPFKYIDDLLTNINLIQDKLSIDDLDYVEY